MGEPSIPETVHADHNASERISLTTRRSALESTRDAMRHPEVIPMFSTEQVTQFQARLHDVIQQAQSRATARAKELEAASRKMLETLGDRAQMELTQLLSAAKIDTRDQVERFGAELEKLGKKIQAMARSAAQSSQANGAASSGVQPPAA